MKEVIEKLDTHEYYFANQQFNIEKGDTKMYKNVATILIVVTVILFCSISYSSQCPTNCGALYGTPMGSYMGIVAYSNGQICTGTGCGNVDYQCVGLIQRFYKQIFSTDLGTFKLNANDANEVGKASNIYYLADNKGLIKYPNNSAIPPRAGDILVFNGGAYGHVAIISDIDLANKKIKIFEQNWNYNSCFRELAIRINGSNYEIVCSGSYSILGWLRHPNSYTVIKDNSSQTAFYFTNAATNPEGWAGRNAQIANTSYYLTINPSDDPGVISSILTSVSFSDYDWIEFSGGASQPGSMKGAPKVYFETDTVSGYSENCSRTFLTKNLNGNLLYYASLANLPGTKVKTVRLDFVERAGAGYADSEQYLLDFIRFSTDKQEFDFRTGLEGWQIKNADGASIYSGEYLQFNPNQGCILESPCLANLNTNNLRFIHVRAGIKGNGQNAGKMLLIVKPDIGSDSQGSYFNDDIDITGNSAYYIYSNENIKRDGKQATYTFDLYSNPKISGRIEKIWLRPLVNCDTDSQTANPDSDHIYINWIVFDNVSTVNMASFGGPEPDYFGNTQTTTTIPSYISPSMGAYSDDGYPITLEVPTDIVTYTESTRITVKCASVPGADGYQLMGADGYVYGGVRGTCNITATRLLPLTTYELLLRATVHNPATDLVIGVSDWVHIIETTEAEKTTTTTTIPFTTTTTTAPPTTTTTTTSISPSSTPSSSSGNLLINGGFENSSVYPWVLEDHNSTGSIYMQSSGSAEGRNCLVITNKLAQEEWKVQLKQTISVKAGVQYLIVLWIKADGERYIYLNSGQEYSPWGNNGLWQPIIVTTEWVKYTIPFTAAFTEPYNRISLMAGNDTPDIYIDGFAVQETSSQQGTVINLLKNGGFELGNSPWLEEDHNNTANFQVISTGAYAGLFCAKITNSTVNQFYQVQLKQINISLTQNQPYTVSFYAKADKARTVYVHVCKEQANWDSAGLWQEINLTTTWQKFEFSFVSLLTESNTRLTIMMGHDTPAVYLDEMALQTH